MHNLSYKSLFLIIVFLLIPIVFLLRLQTAPKSIFAAWWNDSWTYRQAITITVSSSASDITDLDTNLSIGTSSLVASGKLQNDCDDLRFTDISGNILPYFIDSGCNTSTTKIWVRANLVPKNTTTYTVYVYYGNPSASSASSSSTFNLYNGLVGYWNFNENTGTSAADLSVNTNSATFGTGNSAPSWSTGQYGIGLSFSNNNYASVPHHTNQITLPMTISLWAKSNTINQGDWHALVSKYIGASRNGWDFDTSSGNYYFYYYGDASHKIACNHPSEYGCSFGAASTSWSHLVAVVSANGAALYRDGSLVTNASWSGTPMDSTQNANLWIGRITGAASTSFNGSVDDVRIYNRALSSEEITKLYTTPGSIVNASSTVAQPTVSFATEETGGGPIAWWKFDEGVGTTAFDASGKNNHGIFGSGTSAPTWTDESQCISGKCLKFSNNTLTSNLISSKTQNITFQVWTRWLSTSQTNGIIFYSGNSGTNGFGINISNGSCGAGNKITLLLGGTTCDALSSTTVLPTNQWVMITITRDNTTWKMYLNGVFQKSGTTNPGIPIGNTSIGHNQGSGLYNGFIDDVKIYPYARTASQIKADYTSGLAGQSSSNSSTNMGQAGNVSLSNGLVGYWKFDEGVGTTSADSSGNSYIATLTTGTSAASWSNGKFGIGVSLSTNGQYAYVNDSSVNLTTSYSYGGWIKPSANTSDVNIMGDWANSGAGSMIYISGSDNIPDCRQAGNTYGTKASTVLTTGTWSHIMCTWDGQQLSIYINGNKENSTVAASNNDGQNFNIGTYSLTRSFLGSIDEVRIYNRALNPTEVKELYEYAPGPIGYWKFEEGVGTTAYDSSGNGRNATLQNGAIFSNGKYGKALGLNLNGPANQWASFTSISHNYKFTKSAWIYPLSTAQCPEGRCSIIAPYLEILSNLQYYDYSLSPPGWHTGGSIPLNQWSYITVSYDDSLLKLFLNGTPIYSAGATNTGTHYSNAIGAHSSNNRNFHGLIDEVKIYNYARTQSQILEDMNAGSGSKKPIVHYKFDEGQGSLVNNSGIGGTLTGTISGASWAQGKNNKSLSFDGIDDYINLISTGGLAKNLSAITLTYWIKLNSLPATNNNILPYIETNANTGYTKFSSVILSDGSIRTNWRDTLAGTALSVNSPANTISTGQWYHIAQTVDTVNDTQHIYINGNLTIGGTNVTGNIYNDTPAHLTISGRPTGWNTTEYINGTIDDLKIYNYALSSDEVKQDYNQDSTTKVGQSSQTIGATTTNLEYCIPGDASTCSAPIAEWKFEEGAGTTAIDSGSNTYNLPFGTGDSSPTYSTGKFGKSLLFTGNDYIGQTAYSLGITGPVTINTWIKTNSNIAGGIISRYGNSGRWTYRLYMDNTGKIIFNRGNNTTGYNAILTSSTSINNGQWHYLSARYDGTTMKIYINGTENVSVGSTNNSEPPQGNFCIGTDYYDCHVVGTGHFNGSIDHVRIYNYARTPAQIAYDYNKGEPVGWWKLDECQGGTAYDSSGIGNTGSISIGAGGSQTSVGTCTTSGAWFNGVNGKNNSSLSFDGTDDYVNIGTNNNLKSKNISFGAWIKYNALTNYQAIASDNSDFSQYTHGWHLEANRLDSGLQKPSLFIGYGSGYSWQPCSASVTTGQWTHLAFTFDDTTKIQTIYLNGQNCGSKTSTGSIDYIAGNSLSIGAQNAAGNMYYKFSGQIDDVRIYNYALTSTQVKSLYNGGALNFR